MEIISADVKADISQSHKEKDWWLYKKVIPLKLKISQSNLENYGSV